MSIVYVRTLEGRVARVSPKGEYIPHKQHIGVRLTPYISRLAEHHGDIELLRTKPPVAKPAAKQVTTADEPVTTSKK